MRSVLGHTFVMREGRPWISLGTPGNVHCTIPQVLANLLDFGLEPYDAIDMPRMLPLEDDYTLQIESRLPSATVAGMAKLGVRIKPLPDYDYHMGSFQMCWRDAETGSLHSTADPRRAGKAAGF
jgi:gamma-glutamyltranspeptidase/glutathione hydrolase